MSGPDEEYYGSDDEEYYGSDEDADEDAGDFGYDEEDYLNEEDNYLIDGVGFADPGGNSALRAATRDNPRNLPCPTCRRANRLTPIDVARGYQCDACADAVERGY